MKKRIAIYGTGSYSERLLKWIQYRNIDVDICFFIQSKVDELSFFDRPIYSCSKIKDDFDYLIIAVSDKYKLQVLDNLEAIDIYEKIKEKIVSIDEFKILAGWNEDVLVDVPIQWVSDGLEKVGSDYGGYWIDRNVLGEKPIVLSFGIGEEISFDLEMINKFDAQIYAFDPTPKAIHFMEQYKANENISFFPYGIAKEEGEASFYLPKNKEYVSGALDTREELEVIPITVQMKTYSSIVSELVAGSTIDVIKMDIEGSEFDIIPEILNSKDNSVKQIVVEFHERFYPDGISKKNKVLKLLNEKSYLLAYNDEKEFTMSFVKRK
ncbi:methyltransferase, FkbM family [Butyrivibrio sp. INlla18]|uniref:FkbM family methyltransferase n=1 Tax=Butyrivibrio sp. INlla18 TaxID=1520806 RepID=UPI0008887255|nr:FkbM family methyltransferase [Butyrivibrio sp. INlla18]SDA41586.1 methyltransferase, FkbM family [Butyrivibrio sp. INlla18]